MVAGVPRHEVEPSEGTPFAAEVLIRIERFANPQTGFAVLDADHGGRLVVLVGPIAHLEVGERVRVEGSWRHDKRFGPQVRVASAEPVAPSGDAALGAYLRRVRHVGKARAEQLLRAHGDDVLAAVDRDPQAAFRALGLSPRRTGEAVRSWDELRSTRELHLLLAPHGLGWLVPRIDEHYDGRGHRVVRERPYDLTAVFGVGFHVADAIARTQGADPDSAARARAGLIYVLAEAERAGSTCLPVPALASAAGELLGTAVDAHTLGAMAERGELVLEPGAGDALWAYRPETAALEAELAGLMRELAGGRAHLNAREPTGGEVVPAPAQADAVRAALTSRLSIVTGGPGTGKTATIRMICAAVTAQEATVLLVAPTGRAARRMAESTGIEASTVHRSE